MLSKAALSPKRKPELWPCNKNSVCRSSIISRAERTLTAFRDSAGVLAAGPVQSSYSPLAVACAARKAIVLVLDVLGLLDDSRRHLDGHVRVIQHAGVEQALAEGLGRVA